MMMIRLYKSTITPSAVRGSRGFRKIPEDIFEHRLSAAELGTLVLLHMRADFCTGYWHGSAAMLLADCPRYFGDGFKLSEKRVRRILARLEANVLIRRPPLKERSGSWTGYPVAVIGFLITAGPHRGKRLMPDGSYDDASDVPYIALPLNVLELTSTGQLGLVELGLWARLWREAKPSSGIVQFSRREMFMWFSRTSGLDLEIALENLRDSEILFLQTVGTENAALLDGYRVRMGKYRGKILDAHRTENWWDPVFDEPEKRTAREAQNVSPAEIASETVGNAVDSGTNCKTTYDPGNEPQPSENGNGHTNEKTASSERQNVTGWPQPQNWLDAVRLAEKFLISKGDHKKTPDGNVSPLALYIVYRIWLKSHYDNNTDDIPSNSVNKLEEMYPLQHPIWSFIDMFYQPIKIILELLNDESKQTEIKIPHVHVCDDRIHTTKQHLKSQEEHIKYMKKVEAIGMAMAIDHELSSGRNPVDVSELCLGYDIESKPRLIESKATNKTIDKFEICLTPNEFRVMLDRKSQYHVYITTEALTTNKHLSILKNPSRLADRFRKEPRRDPITGEYNERYVLYPEDYIQFAIDANLDTCGYDNEDSNSSTGPSAEVYK